ncbi:MAG: NERD domain-containing protein [Syntrophothermus sp.]
MAQMIPGTCPDNTESPAEILVFKRLQEALDDEWTVFHSFDLNKPHMQNKLIDGEIDFLLFHPAKGLLVLEVKGGSIRYENGVWFQNSQPKNDFQKQAKTNKYAIRDFLKRNLFPSEKNLDKAHLPLALNHAICFPDCFQEIDRLPSGCENAVFYGSQLNYLSELIEERLKSVDYNFKPLDKGQAKLIKDILAPQFSTGSSIYDHICREERDIKVLTEMQSSIMMQMLLKPRVLVKGCAGSGKTQLALRKAKQLADSGKSVLLLCFNTMLGEYLKKEVKGYAKNKIKASTYHAFCLKELKKAGIILNNKQDNFWNEIVPDAFTNLISNKPIKYDALIVDEGQDFHDDFWISISDLVKENGNLIIFYDPDQNIFGRKLSFPEVDVVQHLYQNCRNTKAIFDKIKPYGSEDMTVSEFVPDGLTPEDFKSDSPTIRMKQLSRILYKLIIEEHVPERDIVILGGHALNKTCLGNDTSAGVFRISQNGESGEHIIPYYTYMKFKGCESPVVILLDVCDDDLRWNNTALYTAMTRAKHLLYIIRK